MALLNFGWLACCFSGIFGLFIWRTLPDFRPVRMLGFLCPLFFVSPELVVVLKAGQTKRAGKKRTQKLFEPELVAVIENLRGCLKAGMPLADALEFVYLKKTWVDSIGTVLKTICQCRERGMAVRESLQAATESLSVFGPERFLRQLLHSLMIGQEMGGDLTKLLEKVQKKTQDSMELQRKILVSTAQMRMQAWVVTLAPLALALLLLLLSPGYVLFFFRSLAGWLLLALMIILNIAGAVLLKQISKVDEIC